MKTTSLSGRDLRLPMTSREPTEKLTSVMLDERTFELAHVVVGGLQPFFVAPHMRNVLGNLITSRMNMTDWIEERDGVIAALRDEAWEGTGARWHLVAALPDAQTAFEFKMRWL